MRKTVRLELNEAQRLELERGYHLGEKRHFRMRYLAILLKAEGLSAAKVGERTEMEQHTVSTDERALAAIESSLFVNHSHYTT